MGFGLASICQYSHFRQNVFVVLVFGLHDYLVPFLYETFHLNAIEDGIAVRVDGPQKRKRRISERKQAIQLPIREQGII